MFKTPNINQLPQFLKVIESKWISKRINQNRNRISIDEKHKPIYILSMFPYPSGRLHLGHARCYTSADIIARFCTLLGKPTINPMGFDSFGLPAENAAKERNLDPAIWTNTNIRTMKKQLDDLGVIFDWREATSNPNYYKWTQEIFLKLYDANLIYKCYSKVNWDPVDKTVLADEQVDEDGRSWRSGAKVEKINCKQWFVKVSPFTKALYQADDVEADHWGDILSIQKNWIGKPNGYMFYLPITVADEKLETLLLFVKKPELFLEPNVKLIISKDHWLELEYGISNIKYIQNPFNKSWMELEFASSEDKLPANCNATLKSQNEFDECEEIEEFGDDRVNQHEITRKQVILKAGLDGLGGYHTNENYRDWLISRQRFWGTPIPIINRLDGTHQAVKRDDLPIKLPKITLDDSISSQSEHNSTDSAMRTPLRKFAPKEWLEIKGNDGKLIGIRDCETLDTMFDSSWYFLRYASDPSENEAFNRCMVQPVGCYIGGKEHAYMHLFYARFMTHFLNKIGLLPFKEPFKKLLVQGQVKSKTYKLNDKYISREELGELKNSRKLNLANNGDRIEINYEKMSKSKGNGVEPDLLLDKYGIDATRLCLISYANPRSERLWRSEEEEFKDVFIYLRRVILTTEEFVNALNNIESKDQAVEESKPRLKNLNEPEMKVAKEKLSAAKSRLAMESIIYIHGTNEFRQYLSAMHVAISCLRNYTKTSAILSLEFAKLLASLLIIMNPVAPHLTEELWYQISKVKNNPLYALESDLRLHLNLHVRDQRWPLPEMDYDLKKVSENKRLLYERAAASLAFLQPETS